MYWTPNFHSSHIHTLLDFYCSVGTFLKVIRHDEPSEDIRVCGDISIRGNDLAVATNKSYVTFFKIR